MNERPTPETDEQINGKPCTRFAIMAGDSLRDALVPSQFARKLERERDEILEQYVAMCSRLQECVQEHGIGLGGEKLDKLVCDEIKLLRKDLQEERHAWQNEREDAMADYVAVATENKAMREAIEEAHEALMLSPYRDYETIAKLQPFLPTRK